MQAPVRKKKGRVEEGRVYEIQEEWKQEEKEGIGNKPKETKASKSTNKAEEKAGTGPPAPWGPGTGLLWLLGRGGSAESPEAKSKGSRGNRRLSWEGAGGG